MALITNLGFNVSSSSIGNLHHRIDQKITTVQKALPVADSASTATMQTEINRLLIHSSKLCKTIFDPIFGTAPSSLSSRVAEEIGIVGVVGSRLAAGIGTACHRLQFNPTRIERICMIVLAATQLLAQISAAIGLIPKSVVVAILTIATILQTNVATIESETVGLATDSTLPETLVPTVRLTKPQPNSQLMVRTTPLTSIQEETEMEVASKPEVKLNISQAFLQVVAQDINWFEKTANQPVCQGFVATLSSAVVLLKNQAGQISPLLPLGIDLSAEGAQVCCNSISRWAAAKQGAKDPIVVTQAANDLKAFCGQNDGWTLAVSQAASASLAKDIAQGMPHLASQQKAVVAKQTPTQVVLTHQGKSILVEHYLPKPKSFIKHKHGAKVTISVEKPTDKYMPTAIQLQNLQWT